MNKMERKISKTKIDKKLKIKRNPKTVATLLAAKKINGWLEVAKLISRPRGKSISVNLEKIDKDTKEGDTVIVPGKVLGSGEINKKIRVCALNFSESAREKLKNKKCEVVLIIEEIKKNPKAQGIKIIR